MFDIKAIDKSLLKNLFFTGTCAVLLSACAAGNNNVRTDRIDSALESAAYTADGAPVSAENLAALERLFRRNSDDPDIALRYARTLRKTGYFKRASLILSPFANDESLERADILTEHAAIQSALGNYVTAETAARQSVLMNPDSGEAYHVLGISLDAQGHHQQARTAFDKALEHWEGDPSPVLNNMGLNLAALGFLDDALEKLRMAMATAPNNTEIERNMRIISALQFQPAPRISSAVIPPIPARKPSPDEELKNSAKKEETGSNEPPVKTGASDDTPPVPANEPELDPVEIKEVEAIAPDISEDAEDLLDDVQEQAEDVMDQDITEDANSAASGRFND